MAKKPTAKRTSEKGGASGADPRRAAIDAALDLAASRGWRDTRFGEVAEAAGLTLAELYALFPSKIAILFAFMREVDAAVLAGAATELQDEPTRDRLFDLIMRRFDALAPHKEGVRVIVRESVCHPATGACLSLALARSLAIMLEAAGVDSSGLRGLMRIKGLGAVYLSAFRVWLDDDSEDMAKTMAALDRSLTRAERLMEMLPSRRRRRAAAVRPEAA